MLFLSGSILILAFASWGTGDHQLLPQPDRLAGHGVTPNLNPSVKPAMESEEVGGFYDMMKKGVKMLPNTWESRPNLRYPYYDSEGRGYLLYGYGGKDLYEYSEFDFLEGWY